MLARRPTLSVVIATYEWPEALEAVLASLAEQSDQSFDVVVADDGSRPATAELVGRWQSVFPGRLEHVWQEDDGHRKSRILNLAAERARGEYIAFLDGDSVPRRRFSAAVRRAAIPGWFVASKRLHMSASLSRRVIDERRPVWRWSALRWLVGSPHEVFAAHRETGRRVGVLLPIRDRRRPWRPGQAEFSPPFNAFGFCFGVFRRDFERVNGFDMRFRSWGGEDVDIAIRLRRLGLRCGWPGPDATMLHLWHPQKRSMESNRLLVEETGRSTRVEAVEGLRELRSELEAQPSANRLGASSSSSEPVKR